MSMWQRFLMNLVASRETIRNGMLSVSLEGLPPFISLLGQVWQAVTPPVPRAGCRGGGSCVGNVRVSTSSSPCFHIRSIMDPLPWLLEVSLDSQSEFHEKIYFCGAGRETLMQAQSWHGLCHCLRCWCCSLQHSTRRRCLISSCLGSNLFSTCLPWAPLLRVSYGDIITSETFLWSSLGTKPCSISFTGGLWVSRGNWKAS